MVNREFGELAADFVSLGLLPPGADRAAIVPALTGEPPLRLPSMCGETVCVAGELIVPAQVAKHFVVNHLAGW